MYNPVRGGTRGGQGDFKWSDVASDKDRENYLGHSVNAPVGRWQKNKDLTWYTKDGGPTEEQQAEEIRKVKEAEEDALAVALGFTPTPRIPKAPNNPNDIVLEEAAKARRKEERRLEKEQRHMEREKRRAERAERHKRDRSDSLRDSHRHRSASPDHQRPERYGERHERPVEGSQQGRRNDDDSERNRPSTRHYRDHRDRGEGGHVRSYDGERYGTSRRHDLPEGGRRRSRSPRRSPGRLR